MRRPRKQIRGIIAELRSWLPNYSCGENEFPTLLFRILASLPGGDRLEDMGVERFNVGWHEADLLARTIDAIETKDDVEELLDGVLADDEG